jgi:hypothetical protein
MPLEKLEASPSGGVTAIRITDGLRSRRLSAAKRQSRKIKTANTLWRVIDQARCLNQTFFISNETPKRTISKQAAVSLSFQTATLKRGNSLVFTSHSAAITRCEPMRNGVCQNDQQIFEIDSEQTQGLFTGER